MSSTKRFGPFILERMIGRGGMGAVYRARREDTGEIVAVKALLLPLEQERERFSAEIATMKLLRHDNIVRLYGFGQEDGVLYYAMEYVDGPSLSTLLKRGRRFTWEEVVYIGESICRALKHAHDRGVVHRDIKPANILLLDEGVVKVSDYGIAQYFGSSRLTGVNQVVGTIEYMAPEQAQAGALTPHTDMYSLGALMYVLLTGKPPYPARDLTQLLQKYRQGPPEPVRATRPEIPKVVDEVIFDLLQIQTIKRPGDARVIGRRLEAILKTSSNCPDGNPFKGQKFSLERKPDPEEVESSRVDLENPSKTTLRESEPNFDEPAPDFPYCPVSDEEPEVTSPFDKTTEASPESFVDERNSRKADPRESDFSLDGETFPTNLPHVQTSTALSGDAAPSTTSTKAGEGSDANEADFTLSSSDANDDESLPTRTVASKPGSPGGSRAPLAKHNAPTIVEERPSNVETPLEPTPEQITPEAPSGDTSSTGTTQSTDEMEVVPLEKFKRSQFTQVDETELDRLPREHDDEETKYRWIRVPIMLLILAGIVLLVADLFKTPSPDKLYQRFDRKLQSCRPADFENTLRRMEKDMRKFVDMYPEDRRVDRVNYFLSELEIEELELRLERQVQNSGRGGAKLPVERAYLEACRAASTDRDKGLEQLRAFIILFGTATPEELAAFEASLDADAVDAQTADFYQYGRLSDDASKGKRPEDNMWRKWNGQRRSAMTIQQQLVYIAKRRLVTQRREIKKTNLADLALLNDRLGDVSAIAQEKPERAKYMYEAAVTLYGEQEWAQGALESFRKKLESPQEAVDEEEENKGSPEHSVEIETPDDGE